MSDTKSEVRARWGVATWNLLLIAREEFERLQPLVGCPVFYVTDPFEVWPSPQEGVIVPCSTVT